MGPIRGHALMHEGAAVEPRGPDHAWTRWSHYDYARTNQRQGIGYCECGTASPELPSDAARKRWHRKHKEELKSKRGNQ